MWMVGPSDVIVCMNNTDQVQGNSMSQVRFLLRKKNYI